MTGLSPDEVVEEFLGSPVAQISTRASAQFLACVFGLTIAAIVWASIAKVDRVTRGAGRVVSQERNNIVQHYEGGIITQILVAEGDRVAEGDVLFRIENSFAQAELGAATLDLAVQKLKRDRLLAEANGLSEVVFNEALAKAFPEQVAQQLRFFERRKDELAEALSVFDEQIAEKELELSEKQSRLTNKQRERELMAERLRSLRDLSQAGAVPRNELLQNETALQQVLTQISDLRFQIPQAESALEQAKGRRRESAASFRAEAERLLTETEFEISKLNETIEAQRDRRNRFDVLAPTDGVINKLFVNNVNGVVRPGQNIAEIVSDDAPIEIEARLSPKDRAEVWPGLTAVVKVSAYDYATHGGLEGKVVEISPDALTDEDGSIYFRVRIEADVKGLGEDKPVVPGMQAEIDIITGEQTILSYLLRPINDISSKALRE
ncbi:MAG: HlyD family type I secretion periplasmic adaptor subunit [Alphaproteobacteria bacterium]|nr:HlyD family type I secretion periplasmic adaptor subunit [Alphaproteobacteria bacterium]